MLVERIIRITRKAREMNTIENNKVCLGCFKTECSCTVEQESEKLARLSEIETLDRNHSNALGLGITMISFVCLILICMSLR